MMQGSRATSGQIAVRQPVLFAAAAAALVALLFAPFVAHAANRLVAGEPFGLFGALRPVESALLIGLVSALLAASLLSPTRTTHTAVYTLAWAAVLVMALLLGRVADRMAVGAVPFARTSPGVGWWIATLALLVILRDAFVRMPLAAALRWSGLAAVGLMALGLSGTLDQVSIVKEYAARKAMFAQELQQHLVIAGLGFVPAIVLGLGLGLLSHRRRRTGALIGGVLDTIQVIPAIALFALLMVPLTALATQVPLLRNLGLGGIGPAPAVIGLILYLLLPIVRAVTAGLGAVAPAVLEAADAMGFSPARRLLKVELPLALPVLLAGARIAAVQAIGLATLAALVGGGGLGVFVFQGMGQFALDLVLLGVIPIAVLTACADGALRLVEHRALSSWSRPKVLA